ncbi:MAG: hypothetical protein JW774_02915 [Candidatus Aureabacteria bacterium]|nr:hypothetical protein [Candidatus Auribacterota bacterium]
MRIIRKLILFGLFCFFTGAWGICETVKDSLEMRMEIAPRYELRIETFLSALEKSYAGGELLTPSKNVITPDKDLNGMIDLGHLIARKQGDKVLPLISEYHVLMKVYCLTNKNKSYVLTQKMNSPLTGVLTNETIPGKAFVSQAQIDPKEGQNKGNIVIVSETPVTPGDLQTVYESAQTGEEYLGNVIDIRYWISDQQEENVPPTQRADTYKTTITLTMVEL